MAKELVNQTIVPERNEIWIELGTRFFLVFAVSLSPSFWTLNFALLPSKQAELDRKNWTGRTRPAEQDSQDKTARIRKPGQDSQERIAGTGQLEQDCHDTTSRTRRPGQVFTNRAATTGLLG